MRIDPPEKFFLCSCIFDHDSCYIPYITQLFLGIEALLFEELLECQRTLIVFFSSCTNPLITLLRRSLYIDNCNFCQFHDLPDHIYLSWSVEDDDFIVRLFYILLDSSEENILSKCRSEESAHFRIILPSFSYIEFLQKVPRNTRKGEYTSTGFLRNIS